MTGLKQLEDYQEELEDMKNMSRQEYVAHLRRLKFSCLPLLNMNSFNIGALHDHTNLVVYISFTGRAVGFREEHLNIGE